MEKSMDTILTLEEVAKYLKVSERTVVDWATSGKIPGGKLGNSWRFRRGDIDNWINEKLRPNLSRNAQNSFPIKSLIRPDRVFMTNFKSKDEILNFIIDKSYEIPGVSSRLELSAAIFEREKLMSTGIGLSIAIPHVRLNSVSEISVFIAVNENDITDYEAIDNKPVRILILIIAGRSNHTDYIKVLAKISGLLKSDLTREQILAAKSAKDTYNILTNASESL
jgi:PTS system nitrogen regulatory IIA component